ncbi:hypothetical protein [Coleofasciculus sp. C1-SOL-03]
MQAGRPYTRATNGAIACSRLVNSIMRSRQAYLPIMLPSFPKSSR